MPAALIFDFDGTLVDTMPAHYVAWQQMSAKYGLHFAEDRFYSLGGVPTPKIAAMLVAEAGLQGSLDPDALASEKEQLFLEDVAQVRTLEPVATIAREHLGKLPMAIASGSHRHVVELILRQLRMFDWFQAVVTSEDTTRHKPDPDVFLEAARRIGVAPADCMVYEDTETGLEAARRAGMPAVDVRELLLHERR